MGCSGEEDGCWRRRMSFGEVTSSSEDAFEDYLDAVLIGGREERELILVDYLPAWATRFDLERARILEALGEVAARVEHVGSTAVPGLAAKPIIDILVAVNDPDDEGSYLDAMEGAGYELWVREPGHRMFRTPERDVHVHVWRDSDPEVERYLRFRDLLRRSPADRRTYEQLKRELAQFEWADTNHYADAKTPLIEQILAGQQHRSRGSL